VTVSSVEERDFYDTPRLRDLLSKTRKIRREVTRLGGSAADATTYNRLLKNLDDLEETLSVHFKELFGFERDLMIVASTRLSGKQRTLLGWLSNNYRGEAVYTTLIERISDELGIPRSTVRWNLGRLRQAGLIRAGDRLNKGVPVALTARGAIMAEYAAATS
jgi:DNA-binding transcriptional ArsR family regulator